MIIPGATATRLLASHVPQKAYMYFSPCLFVTSHPGVSMSCLLAVVGFLDRDYSYKSVNSLMILCWP